MPPAPDASIGGFLAFWASSMMAGTWLGGMTALAACFLRFCGFIDGDCRTVRPGVLAAEVGRLVDFRPADDALVADRGAFKSRFISIGEVVSDVSDRFTAPYPDGGWACFCASSAGEVSGLKYSPGTGYSGYWNCVSNGVTAGETSGVKVIFRPMLAYIPFRDRWIPSPT